MIFFYLLSTASSVTRGFFYLTVEGETKKRLRQKSQPLTVYSHLMDKWGGTVGSLEKLHDIRPTEERIARIGFWFFRVKRVLSDLRTQAIKVSCDHGTIDRVSKSI